MRIDQSLTHAAGNAVAARAPAGTAGRPAFRLGATDRAENSASARSAAPLATLDAILMLQGEEDRGERRRRSARRGQDILDALDRLRAGLLSGQIDVAALSRLSDRLAGAAGSSGDPGLDATVAAIELRAKVELAKLGRS